MVREKENYGLRLKMVFALYNALFQIQAGKTLSNLELNEIRLTPFFNTTKKWKNRWRDSALQF